MRSKFEFTPPERDPQVKLLFEKEGCSYIFFITF